MNIVNLHGDDYAGSTGSDAARVLRGMMRVRIHLRKDSGAAKNNNSFEMMNYSGIVEIQKPCYTKNGIWENGSSGKKVIRNELCWDC